MVALPELQPAPGGRGAQGAGLLQGVGRAGTLDHKQLGLQWPQHEDIHVRAAEYPVCHCPSLHGCCWAVCCPFPCAANAPHRAQAGELQPDRGSRQQVEAAVATGEVTDPQESGSDRGEWVASRALLTSRLFYVTCKSGGLCLLFLL